MTSERNTEPSSSPLSHAPMPPEEFRAIQGRLGLKNHELAAELGRSLSSVAKYRSGDVEVPTIVAKMMRLME